MNKLVPSFFAAVTIASVLLTACGVPSGPAPATPAAAPGKGEAKSTVPAWQERWDGVLAAARKEGKAVIYGQVGPELREALTTAARNEFGLDLEFTVGKGAELSTKFMAEWQAGIHNADIMLWGASTHLTILKPKGTLERIEPLLILPETVDPAAWRDGKLPFVDKENMVIPLVAAVMQHLLVNTDTVKQGQINSFKDLLQPQWKGKIVMFDPTMGGSAAEWVTLILAKSFGPVEGEKFLRQYAAQEPLITKDSRLQIEWLARGRYPVSVAVDGQAAYTMQKAGAPITRLKTEEGGLLSGGGGYLGLPVKRPHPNATIVLVNWLLGPRGQPVFGAGWGAPATRLGVASEGISLMALPLPGEKLFQADEEFVLAQDNAKEVAKKIFAPVMK